VGRWPWHQILRSVAATAIAAAAAQAAEIQLNVSTEADQESIRIVSGPGIGRWAAVWESELPTNAGIFLRIFDADGVPLGDEQRVNVYTNGAVSDPAIAANEDGVFVAYSALSIDGSGYGVAFRRFDVDGDALDAQDMPVNTITNGPQFRPEVAASPDGSFAVVFCGWSGADQDIYLRRFSDAGIALDPVEVRVNALGNDGVTLGDQGHPGVSFKPNGGFVVVYEDRYWGRTHGVRFDASGTSLQSPSEPPGARQFDLAPTLAGEQTDPAVCGLENGGFVVALNVETNSPADRRVHAVTFALNGVSQGAFLVGAHTNRWEDARLAGLAAGGFVAAWQAVGEGSDGTNEGWSVHTQRFGPTGTPYNVAHRVNETNSDDQDSPRVAAAGDDYAIAWRSHGQDGSGYGGFYTDFAAPSQTALGITPGDDNLPGVAFPSAPYEIYGVESSTDLVSWSLLFLTNSPTDVLDFMDDSAPFYSRRFFRAWQYP
jgi:hypothetical protein